jgi:hypothetical protein
MEIMRCCVRDDPARDLDVGVGDEVEMERRFHVEGEDEEENQRLSPWGWR